MNLKQKNNAKKAVEEVGCLKLLKCVCIKLKHLKYLKLHWKTCNRKMEANTEINRKELWAEVKDWKLLKWQQKNKK